MSDLSTSERIQGALVGAFVGEALAVGPHWYYDIEELHRVYGLVSDYTDPQPDRYHRELKAGDGSQPAFILALLAESLLESDGFDIEHWQKTLDEKLLPQLNGEPAAGPGGYTSQSIRELYRQRVQQAKPWANVIGSKADTTEGIERDIVLSLIYARNPKKLAETVKADSSLTQSDDVVLSMTVAFCEVLGQIIAGEAFDEKLPGKLMDLVKNGELPFHAVTRKGLKAPQPGDPDPPQVGFASPDALLSPLYMISAAHDKDIKIEPAWKVSKVYGFPCAIYHILPAVYYLAARFSDNFEEGVLAAVNSGGQNQVRAMLTGALIGAQVGIKGIPQRFIDGLNDRERVLKLAKGLAELEAKQE